MKLPKAVIWLSALIAVLVLVTASGTLCRGDWQGNEER